MFESEEMSEGVELSGRRLWSNLCVRHART